MANEHLNVASGTEALKILLNLHTHCVSAGDCSGQHSSRVSTVYTKCIPEANQVSLYMLIMKHWTPVDSVPTHYSDTSGSVSSRGQVRILPSVAGTLHPLHRSVPRLRSPTPLQSYPTVSCLRKAGLFLMASGGSGGRERPRRR